METTIVSYGAAFALLGGALSAALGGLGSTLGVGEAGVTGAGVITEKPEVFGKVLVLEAMPGSQAIYGLIGAFLVLSFFGEKLTALTTAQGLSICFSCLPLAITALLSAIFQGKVAAAGMNIVAKDPASGGKAIVLAAMVETFAILGLLTTFLMLKAIADSMAA